MFRRPAVSRVVAALSIFVLSIGLGTGCGSEPTCADGLEVACVCEDGRVGVARCSNDGSFGACECTGPVADGDGGMDTAPDAAADGNLCGGEAPLLFGGRTQSPGDPCGECGKGVLVCDGPEALRCIAQPTPNACGGCGPLPAEPDSACGFCDDGVLECDGDLLACQGAGPANACGGCAELEAEPSTPCGGDGVWVCAGGNALTCAGLGENACGGEGILDAYPGTPCGACLWGLTTCDGANQIRCDGEDDGLNSCGGCTPLEGEPGTECGDCGGA